MKISFNKAGLSLFDALKRFNIASPSSWRESSLAQIWLCALLGIFVSCITLLLHDMVQLSREFLFGLPKGVRLSAAEHISVLLVVAIPVLGGIVLSLSNWLMQYWRGNDIVDPIEANAVHGGKMSIRDTVRLCLSTVISNASGVSIGMEAAYSQAGSGFMSRIGQKMHLRRQDLRIFVAAGSAAAIAAAFNAPLAGAFYGFELILGIYTIRALPHVAAAALSSTLFMRMTTNETPIFYIPMENIEIPPWHYFIFLGMGILAARIGVITMKSVTYCEKLSKRVSKYEYLRPVIGGLLVGFIALAFPQILGSGQGAINHHLHNDWPFILLLSLLGAKIIASAVTVGFGFRGGLFSASLFIGCLFGQIVGKIAALVLPENPAEMPVFILTGMGAVAASVVGAPITIILLILEMTESFSATTPVFAAVLVSAIITRYTFGYSFSTWRFHVRGLRISGAFDIGWINEMPVARLMQGKFETASSALSIKDMRDLYPPTRLKRIFLVSENGFYEGTLDIAELHNADLEDLDQSVTMLAHNREHFLLPSQNIKQALDLFTEWEMEELPVLASIYDRTIKGSLIEAHVLRRYAKELEAQNLAQSGAATPPVKSIT